MINKTLDNWAEHFRQNPKDKPKAKVIGADGNVFNLMGICCSALDQVDASDAGEELTDRVMGSHSYNEALCIMQEYCVFR